MGYGEWSGLRGPSVCHLPEGRFVLETQVAAAHCLAAPQVPDRGTNHCVGLYGFSPYFSWLVGLGSSFRQWSQRADMLRQTFGAGRGTVGSVLSGFSPSQRPFRPGFTRHFWPLSNWAFPWRVFTVSLGTASERRLRSCPRARCRRPLPSRLSCGRRIPRIAFDELPGERRP